MVRAQVGRPCRPLVSSIHIVTIDWKVLPSLHSATAAVSSVLAQVCSHHRQRHAVSLVPTNVMAAGLMKPWPPVVSSSPHGVRLDAAQVAAGLKAHHALAHELHLWHGERGGSGSRETWILQVLLSPLPLVRSAAPHNYGYACPTASAAL